MLGSKFENCKTRTDISGHRTLANCESWRKLGFGERVKCLVIYTNRKNNDDYATWIETILRRYRGPHV